MPKTYVLILTYNRLRMLRRLIDNPMFWSPQIDQVIVRSQACADGTDQWLREYAAAHPERPIELQFADQNRMAIGGRNDMFETLVGRLERDDIFVTLDDDMIPISPHWLEKLTSPLRENPEVGAAGIEGFWTTFGPGIFMHAPEGEVDIINGGWSAYRGAVLLDGCRYDEQYLPFWHADSDFAMQVLEKGWKLVKVGRIGLAHSPHHRKVDELWQSRRDIFLGKWRGKGITSREKEYAALLATVVPEGKPTGEMTIYAPDYDPYTGYGRMACEFVYRMAAQGVLVNASGSYPVSENQTRLMQALVNRPHTLTVGGLLFGYPTLHEEYGPLSQHGPRIAVTMFESTKIPREWVKPLNACDAVIVPSTFLVDVFKKAGVRKPIHVVPLGISETYHYVQRPRDRRPYTFLALGDRGTRKGWLTAIKAFVNGFGDDENYRLIIKCRASGLPVTIGNPNIEILAEDMTESEMFELYKSVDCYVFPTHGEGFGLPPREAAATGLPVIATNWGGTADHLMRWGYPLRYELVKAWKDHSKFGARKLGQWAEPDVEHLVAQMKYVSASQKPVCGKRRNLKEQQAWRSSERARRLYSWERWARSVYEIWQGVVLAKSKPAPEAVGDRRTRRKSKAVSNAIV
jgi:glycosyltransferase involved in cell wall biosynthesis